MNTTIEHCKSGLSKLNWLPPLLARFSLGVVFAESGWGKVHNIKQVTEYFTSLGIPFATLQAPFVAGLELVGGILLIFGIASRLMSVALIGVMFVAIITAKLAEIISISDIFGISEFLYILLLFWIAISGPGSVALDRIISKKKKDTL